MQNNLFAMGKGISHVVVYKCPKCGGEPIWGEVFLKYYIRCKSCGFRGPYGLGDLYKAVCGWNKLAEDK